MNFSSSSRREFLSGLAGASLAGGAPAARALPNIVLILADDLGWGDLSCYNRASKIDTPNLDRLAAQGICFTDAHTPSAVCTPTRYGLLTGRYPWRSRLKSGVLDGFDPPLIEPGRVTAASLLKRRGYATACVGKWHLGMQWTTRDGAPVPAREPGAGFRPGYDVDFTRPIKGGPLAVGFDWYYGISASLDMSPYCFIENDRTAGVPDIRTAEDKTLFMNQVPGVRTKDFRLEDVVPVCTRKASEFIARRKGARNPFFLYLALSSPHLPVVPNREFEGRSRAGRYGDFVAEMDAAVGKVLEALDQSGAASNTLVIFSSDNGGLWHWWDFKEADDVARGKTTPRGAYVKGFGHQSNAWMRGTKADVWEGGHRVPFLARWPGRIKPGTVSDALICHTDFLATCADIAGTALPPDAGEDSFSLLPALLDGARRVRDHVISHSLRGEFVVRRGDWKLIPSRGSGGFSVPRTVEAGGGPKGQLYNLREDPGETRNLYGEQPGIVAELSRLLAGIQSRGRSR